MSPRESAAGTAPSDPEAAGTDPVELVLGRLMLGFEGLELAPADAQRLRDVPAAGVSLFRYRNVDSAGQVRSLTDSMQRAAREGGRAGPLLIAADQEGGQLIGLGDESTPFPGNMALGAAGDVGLAERVGRAIGLECLALGANVVYAPSCDLASNPANPGLGIRSFGDDPAAVAALAAAFVRGVRASGAAATAKHFPGLGSVSLDSHLGLAAVPGDEAALDAAELRPFRAAIGAGVELVMSAHVAVPGVTGDAVLPATLSRAVMERLLRDHLGFRGLSITDALDMAALPRGPDGIADVVAAVRAGMDLLLLAPEGAARRSRTEAALVQAARRGLFDPHELRDSRRRVDALRARLARVEQPGLELVGGAEHAGLAREVAGRALTLVRDDTAVLPLRLAPDATLLAVMPRPAELTPADTSGSVAPGLAAALRGHHARVDEIVTGHSPGPDEIAAVRARAQTADAVVIGTIAASFDASQVDLVHAVLGAGRPTVTVALRTPWDLAAYPEAPVHVCTYGLLAPSMEALAAALLGGLPFSGRLPVDLPGIAPRGHGLDRGT